MCRLTRSLFAAVLGMLVACAAGPAQRLSTAHDRIGNDRFTLEVPSEGEWDVQRSDVALTLERRQRAWLQTVGTTLIRVSILPVPNGSHPRSEKELAAGLLKGCRDSLYSQGQTEAVTDLFQSEELCGGKKVYVLHYQSWSHRRSEGLPWGDENSRQVAEICLYFPQGIRSAEYVVFEMMDSQLTGWPRAEHGERWIEGVIGSFQLRGNIQVSVPGAREDGTPEGSEGAPIP